MLHDQLLYLLLNIILYYSHTIFSILNIVWLYTLATPFQSAPRLRGSCTYVELGLSSNVMCMWLTVLRTGFFIAGKCIVMCIGLRYRVLVGLAMPDRPWNRTALAAHNVYKLWEAWKHPKREAVSWSYLHRPYPFNVVQLFYMLQTTHSLVENMI